MADPVVGYFYKSYLLGVPQDLAKALAKIGAITTSVNAVIAVIVATIILSGITSGNEKDRNASGIVKKLETDIELKEERYDNR